jgi:hypothetical protein
MKKPKRPDVKMPELKAPAFVGDLYYDLRDRRLLPLVALVVVAIAAVPFLLGGKSENGFVAPPDAPLSSLGSSGSRTSKLTVVEATPGLRDYRKRLADRSPTNPFKQRYTGLPESAQVQSGASAPGAESSGAGSLSVTESSTIESTKVTESGSPGTGSSGGSGGSGNSAAAGSGKDKAPKLEFVIDIQISHTEKAPDGGEEMSPIEVRHDVPILTQLPGKKTSVVTLLGANVEKQRLVFLVSHAVKAISGEYSCVTRGEICELLEVREGVLLEYVYEPTGVRYAIKVTNAAVIPARKNQPGRSSRAAFILSQAGSTGPQSFSK